MHQSMLSHPSSVHLRPVSLEFECIPGQEALNLSYRVSAEPGVLCIPPFSSHPVFTDDLWQHTCFELFAAAEGSESYREFNFAPSGHWAAYAFSGYRQRVDWQVKRAPQLQLARHASLLELTVELPLILLPEASCLKLSATAVLESVAGELTYWALNHAGERPDFHRRESFILELALST